MRIAALLLACVACAALPARADKLDDAILHEMKRSHVPGVSVLVARNGKVIREQGYGMADLEHNIKVTPKTVFQSGSIGKTFTAALIVLLAEDGKLKLDDPISLHLANTPKAWEGITVRHLLTHTSGLGDPYAKLDFRKDYTDEELIAFEGAIPTRFAPGEKWAYSNMGYHLLGFIANKVGGKFYGDQLRERIFAPLGMQTRIISESDIIANRSSGYEWDGKQIKNQAWVAPRLNTTADGSLYLTARDLLLWDQAMYGDKILNEKQRAASFTPVKLNNGKSAPYGYGWQLDPVNGHRSISHGGSWQGFKTQLSRLVDDKLTVIVLANSASANPVKLTNLIFAHYEPKLAKVPEKAIEDTEPAVMARARAAVASLTAGQVPAALGGQAALGLTPEYIKFLAPQLKELGPLLGVEALTRAVDGEKRRYRYRFRHADEMLIVDVTIGKDDLIEALRLRPE
jgi:CubicO group peptidase (beta-lactamase class C family)